MMIGKIQYAYTNPFTDKNIYSAPFKTATVACQ